MNPITLYRAASVLLLIFAAGHTSGVFSKPPSPEAKAVNDAMNGVHFTFMGADCTYGGFQFGYGLTLTGYLLFGALMAWQLGGLSQTQPGQIQVIAWGFFTCQALVCAISWKYFFAGPGVISTLVVLCLGGAAWQLA